VFFPYRLKIDRVKLFIKDKKIILQNLKEAIGVAQACDRCFLGV
jgi:hypothetical protein